MSSSLMRAECRKFIPNIFNKTKCSNCFRQKEEHTAEALESNRAARKISKCGYLFVAPGWDFSNPLNRTKRWQRRWFVLYDDGELNYSLDEHPDTVPQASIDMNNVVDVSDAEEITGNSFSIAINTPDSVHFVKGTCREEAKWWKDVLNVFPRSKGRHKRNATFPGSQSSSILQSSSLSCRSLPDSRPRFNSCHTDPGVLIHSPSAKWLNAEDEIYPTRDIEISVETPDTSSVTPDTRQDYSSDPPHSDSGKSFINHHPASSSSPPTRDKVNLEERIKTRRSLNIGLKIAKPFSEDILRDGKSGDCFADDLTSIINNRNINQDINSIMREGASDRNDVTRRILFESEKSKREEKLKDIAESLTRPRLRRRTKTDLSSIERMSLNQLKPTRDGECSDEERSTSSELVSTKNVRDEVDSTGEKSIRGDPDGCGLDLTLHRFSPSSELRVDLPAEDLLNIKKGWLLKQGTGQEWTKHWFVLRGVALMYYRDPTAEDKGILDGVMDLSSVNNVSEVQVQRNYGFLMVSWDDKRYILSAATAGIRNNWMTAIRKAAGLVEPIDVPSINFSEKIDRDVESSRSETKSSQYFENGNSSSRNNYIESGPQRNGNSPYVETSLVPLAPYENSSVSISRSPSSQYVDSFLRKTASNHFMERNVKRSSSTQSLIPELYKVIPDEDYRQRLENNSKEKEDWNKGPTPLPPSPPLNRTPISKVKERAKTQTSRSRVYNKRSKSSPPSSRRNTLDVVRTDEGICGEKRDEPIKRSTILDKVDRHVKEIDELKGQLSLALCERSTAERELSRLRQRKSEANQQVEELLRSLKIAEDELKIKTQELENFENLKQRYSELVKEHEGMLKSWRESAINDGWRAMYQQLKEEYANDKEAWEMKLADVTSMLHVATERCEMLARELTCSEETVEALKAELTNLSERLMRGLEENEGLYGRMRELEGRCLSSSRERGRSVDSLSDLTNIDLDIDLDTLDKERIIEEYEELKGRFEKAIQEIRAMKKELRESHASYDELELTVINLRQDSKRREENGKAQAALMASRIEDLTLKLSASEKQSRLLKQKILKSESREKRRSLSLKGKECFHISRETEEKLAELEAKISALELGKSTSSVIIKTATPPLEMANRSDIKTTRMRRKSLESVTSVEPMKILVRMFSLERKIAKAAESLDAEFKYTEQPELSVFEERNEGVSKIRGKLQECKNILTTFKSVTHGSSKSLTALEGCLKEIENALIDLTNSFFTFSKEQSLKMEKSADYLIHKLESLLKTKMSELMDKRQQLIEKNLFDDEAKLQLLAEKLAYESVLIRKIRETVEESSVQNDSWKRTLNFSEIQEINALMTLVQRKITGESIFFTGNASDDLSKTLAENLTLEGELTSSSTNKVKVLIDANELPLEYQKLLERQKALERLIEAYKIEMLQGIAESLAIETLHSMEEYEDSRKGECKEDKKIREAWSFAQETLNKDLVQAEISHIAMRCLLTYENGMIKEQEGKLTLIAEKYKRQEEYLQKVDESLRMVIDSSIKELTAEFEKVLNKLNTEKVVKSNESIKEEGKKYRKKMEDLFSVIAQKTIIDARIFSLNKAHQLEKLEISNRPVVRGVCLKNDLTEPNFETRFIYFYQKFKTECLQSVGQVNSNQKDLTDVAIILNSCSWQVKRIREILRLAEAPSDPECESSLNSIREKCRCLSANVEDIVACIRGGMSCRQCSDLEEALHAVETRYDEEIRALKHCHQKELKDLRGELESQRNSLVCQHEQEQAQLIERTRRLERRLGTLDAEYSQQIDNLRSAYHKTLSADLGQKEGSSEESIRQRYQAEIKQLRTLCEKGLIAVDSSHRRIIAELEEKHRQELAAAAAEKEQALAEETQATLAALDAMRKAHETEVQREINKFKAEFLKKMQNNHDIGALHKGHEAEMEEIKKEILSLSEKYSVKCVESASLEEQLSVVSKQLNQAQEHIMQLDARNKQLRAHLVSDTAEFEDFEGIHPFKSEKENTFVSCHDILGELHYNKALIQEKRLPPTEKNLTNLQNRHSRVSGHFANINFPSLKCLSHSSAKKEVAVFKL